MSSSSIAKEPYPLLLKNILITTAVSVGYLLLSYILIGYKTEQLFLVLLFNALYYISKGTRRFIIGFSIFIIFWILFDYMKAFPNYRYNTVHIKSIYDAEKALFGIMQGGAVLTPNEYWLTHQSTFLDIFSGFAYLCWMPVPLFFACYLFYTNRRQFYYFALTFLLVNLVGFVGYYSYPAAPPWYIQLHGFDFNAATPGNTAGLDRFDQYFHTTIFKGLYTKSSNVFAAMPSLHAAYPSIVLYYGIKNRMGYINLLFALVVGGIWFAAVYSSHHYVLDVMAGICCAIIGFVIFHFLKSAAWFDRFISRLVSL
ncbi:PAP2 superfamily protein [Filimonas lacunae]|uniref:PAP2 superfamily protein n=1 Tax=Filimonas lacunae TaxID=477680 RepID=A0A173MM39_9BACT|nr:phosphatase PAP2 family protein [Filimonas lacunae]BAV08715.1 phosphoesterase, PA-phosphatase related [Filimonas lacunae]SIS60458.1 PAP2 superfamily protein [Filimonas lacunae]